jgi:hypothetical protein
MRLSLAELNHARRISREGFFGAHDASQNDKFDSVILSEAKDLSGAPRIFQQFRVS